MELSKGSQLHFPKRHFTEVPRWYRTKDGQKFWYQPVMEHCLTVTGWRERLPPGQTFAQENEAVWAKQTPVREIWMRLVGDLWKHVLCLILGSEFSGRATNFMSLTCHNQLALLFRYVRQLVSVFLKILLPYISVIVLTLQGYGFMNSSTVTLSRQRIQLSGSFENNNLTAND